VNTQQFRPGPSAGEGTLDLFAIPGCSGRQFGQLRLVDPSDGRQIIQDTLEQLQLAGRSSIESFA
jgi:hypothetical protein